MKKIVIILSTFAMIGCSGTKQAGKEVKDSMTSQLNEIIDINKMPEQGQTPIINLKDAKKMTLSNGAVLLVVENPKLPVISLTLAMDVPSQIEKKQGVSSLTAALMGQGTKLCPKKISMKR